MSYLNRAKAVLFDPKQKAAYIKALEAYGLADGLKVDPDYDLKLQQRLDGKSNAPTEVQPVYGGGLMEVAPQYDLPKPNENAPQSELPKPNKDDQTVISPQNVAKMKEAQNLSQRAKDIGAELDEERKQGNLSMGKKLTQT